MSSQAMHGVHDGGAPFAVGPERTTVVARARRGADARGEAAALHTLAACYRALGRDEDATKLESLRGVL